MFKNPRQGTPYIKGRYVVAQSSTSLNSATGLMERQFRWGCDPSGPGYDVPDRIKFEIEDPVDLLVLAANLDPNTFDTGDLPIGLGL